jgi:uncharacterized protein
MLEVQDVEQHLKEAFPSIEAALGDSPPTIGLVGVSGTGKSSTINAMFGTSLPTSDTVACTKEFEHRDIELGVKKGAAAGMAVHLKVIDAPGLGEDIARDQDYLEMYQKNLAQCDVVLWVLTARNRAIALDQMYLESLRDFHSKMVFGLNQADLVEPMNWIDRVNLPSLEQENNLKIILQDRKERLESIIKLEAKIVAYSSKTGWNLQELFSMLITSCMPEKAWILEGLQSFHYTDFIPAEVLETLGEKKKASERPWWTYWRQNVD